MDIQVGAGGAAHQHDVANGQVSPLATDKTQDFSGEPPRRTLFRSLFHWGPILAMSITGSITMVSIMLHMQWWPLQTVGAYISLVLFMFWNAGTLSNLMAASFVGPGYVKLKWQPVSPEARKQLQFCRTCDCYKAPRSHHCRQCNRCVLKMDHHCPWINNCVGYQNQPHFLKFLAFAVVGCTHATWIIGSSIWYGLFRFHYLYYGTGYEPSVELTVLLLFGSVFAFGLAVGVICGVGYLLFVQIRILMRNKTGIEDYIIAKASYRREDDEEPFIYPYDLGWKKNVAEVLTWSGTPKGNGFEYPVLEGCDQFTLTNEQIAQKAEKRQAAVLYEAHSEYNGARIFACKYGCRTCMGQQIVDPARLAVQPGDQVVVTRGSRHWLYGEKIVDPISMDGQGDVVQTRSTRTRGWFPRSVGQRAPDMECEEIEEDTPETREQATQHEKAE